MTKDQAKAKISYEQKILSLMRVINKRLENANLMSEDNYETLSDIYEILYYLNSMLKDNIK